MMKNHDNITIIHKWKKTWNTLWKWGERYRKLFGSLKVVDGLFLNKTLVSFHLFLPWKPRDWITWSVAERDTTGAPIKQCLCRPIHQKRQVKLSELEILQKLWSKWLSNSKFCSQIVGFSNEIKTTKRAQRKTEWPNIGCFSWQSPEEAQKIKVNKNQTSIQSGSLMGLLHGFGLKTGYPKILMPDHPFPQFDVKWLVSFGGPHRNGMIHNMIQSTSRTTSRSTKHQNEHRNSQFNHLSKSAPNSCASNPWPMPSKSAFPGCRRAIRRGRHAEKWRTVLRVLTPHEIELSPWGFAS